MTTKRWPSTKQRPLAERLWEKALADGTGCWIWFGATNPKGYGMIRADADAGRRVLIAHRVAYELVKGLIPEGFDVDHLCRRRACINPSDLEAVPHRENILRGHGVAGNNARKTHCKHGHEFTSTNIVRKQNGGRNCRTCATAYNAERRARRRVES